MMRRLISLTLVVAVAGCSGGDIGTSTSGGNGGSGGSANNGGNGGGAGGSGGSGGSTGGNGGSTGGNGGSTGNGNGGNGGSTGTGLPGGVALAGAYDVTTQFNLLDALPPDVKTALSLTLELADSPGSFLLDMADKIPVIKYVIDAINAFSGVRAQIVMAIDDYINKWSGGLVTTMRGISQQLEMALRGLSMHSKLVLSAPDANGDVAVVDTLVDISFKWNGHDHPYPQNMRASATAHLQGLKLAMPAHSFDRGLDFGAILVDLLDNVALPELTGVNSLGALVNQLVNCTGVADWIWGYIGNTCIGNTCISQFISANDLAKLCVNTLNMGGDLVEAQLAALTAPGKMGVGDLSCLAVENNGHTGHADSLTNGTWSLTLPVGSATITLPGAFSGSLSH
jgi:hypothetical protein